MDGDMKMGMTCKCPHHKIMPILVILFGLDFLLFATGTLSGMFVSVSWPILVIIAGCMKLFKCGCCSKHEEMKKM
jgi:hypothetical protein